VLRQSPVAFARNGQELKRIEGWWLSPALTGGAYQRCRNDPLVSLRFYNIVVFRPPRAPVKVAKAPFWKACQSRCQIAGGTRIEETLAGGLIIFAVGLTRRNTSPAARFFVMTTSPRARAFNSFLSCGRLAVVPGDLLADVFSHPAELSWRTCPVSSWAAVETVHSRKSCSDCASNVCIEKLNSIKVASVM
jgi:hypothetical protein